MPILEAYSLEIISRSAEQTRRVGMRLGALLQTGDLIGLVWKLGSGKTTLAKGIATGWGSLDPVSSPTFVIVNVYRRPDGKRLFHMDAYRLRDANEAIDLDLDDMLENGTLKELKATSVLRLPIAEASAKIRTGPPSDDLEDLSLPVWAGVLPLETIPGEPVPDEAGGPAEVPLHVLAWPRGR